MVKFAVRLSLLVALIAPPPLAAGMKYAVHMETRQAAGTPDQFSVMMGAQMAQIFPAGGIDQAVTVGEKGSRTEQKQAFAGMAAGTVIITHADGTAVGMDPAAKTFWKQPSAADAAAQMAQLGVKPEIKASKTGQFETIDGMKAERVNVTMTMPIPGIDPSQMPPGFPTQITVSMDAFMTDAIKNPVGSSAIASAMLAKMGFGEVTALKELNDGRFMLKQVTTMFGIEIVMTVKDVHKEDVADASFDVPKDFKEVPPPGGGGH